MPSVRRLLAACSLLALAGCVQPDDAALYRCEAARHCPEDFSCNTEGYCIRDDAGVRPPDAAALLDATRVLDSSFSEDASEPEPLDADLTPGRDAAQVRLDATAVQPDADTPTPLDAAVVRPQDASVVTVPDASVAVPPDAGIQPKCGAMSEVCCSGTSACGPGLTCANGLCIACGTLALPCCPGGTCTASLVCDAIGLCAQCGLPGGPCCTGGDKMPPPCNGAYGCMNGLCAPCGHEGQLPCNPTVPCAPGFAVDVYGKCTACGTHLAPCCPGGGCPAGCCDLPGADGVRLCIADSMDCPVAGFSCLAGRCGVQDCGQVGGECCWYTLPGSSSAAACTGATPLACSGTRCAACGTLDAPCCLGGVCLGPGLACNATTQTCQPCGHLASTTTLEACCPGGVCVNGCCSNGTCVPPGTTCSGEGVCSASGACTGCGENACCPSGACLDPAKRCTNNQCQPGP